MVNENLILGNDGGGQALFTQTGGSAAINSAGFGGYINNGTYAISGGTLTVANNLIIGDANSLATQGKLQISGSGGVSIANDLSLASQPLSSAQVQMSSSTPLNTGRTIVGERGFATFVQSAGTHLIGALGGFKDLIAGSQAGSQGSYLLSGGVLDVRGSATLGDMGQGVLNISGNGRASVTGLTRIASQAGATGSLEVSGSGSFNGLFAGAGVPTLVAGVAAGSNGGVIVTAGATLTAAGRMVIGDQGSGSMLQSGTSTIQVGSLRLGAQAGGVGSAQMNGGTLNVLDGTGVEGGMRVGLGGSGTFTQTDGTVNASYVQIGGANFGQGGGGTGTYHLSGGR